MLWQCRTLRVYMPWLKRDIDISLITIIIMIEMMKITIDLMSHNMSILLRLQSQYNHSHQNSLLKNVLLTLLEKNFKLNFMVVMMKRIKTKTKPKASSATQIKNHKM